jgi:hypothetical protein
MKFPNFFLHLWVIFALLYPDPDSEYGSRSTDLIESGSGSLCAWPSFYQFMQFRRDGGPADNLSSPTTRGPDDGGVAQLLQKDCPGNFLSVAPKTRAVDPVAQGVTRRCLSLLTNSAPCI